MASLLSLSTTTATTSREQSIENYKALLKKKKDITRKNKAIQTKIAHYVRKNKIDLISTVTRLTNLSTEEEAKAYEELLENLKDINEDQSRETNQFLEETYEIQSKLRKTEMQISNAEEKFKDAKTM